MIGSGKLRLRGAMALALSTLAVPAGAQQAAQPQNQAQPQGQSGPIGSPQLRDFQLTPRQRLVTQPAPAQPAAPATQPTTRQTTQTAPRPTATRPSPAPARPAVTPERATPRPDAPVEARPQAPTTEGPVTAAPAPVALPPAAETAPVETTTAPAPAPTSVTPATSPLEEEGPPLWLFLVGGLALGIAGYVLLGRRRAAARRRSALPKPVAPTTVQPVAPRAPRADPVPRPWLEIELSPERTTADPDNSVVEFELTVRNNGGSTARNVRLQAKLISSTPDQDKEIAAFHRLKPGEHRTLEIPDVGGGQELRLKGQVEVKREDLKALRMNERLIWVPLVAVNAFYDWGTVRTGQTSKSFLIGREKPEKSDKMAPFRMDLGPRVYRAVGQRPYKIERRV